MKKITAVLLSILSFSLISCQGPTNSNPSVNPSVSPSSGASASPGNGSSGGTFSYIAMDTDKVSPGTNVTPDGIKDHHFTASYKFAAEAEIRSIIISRYEGGVPKRISGWEASHAASISTNYWVLAVEANGKALNTSNLDFNAKLSGDVKFDFYGSDNPGTGLANPGTSYQLELTYKDAAGKDNKITVDTKL